MNKHKLSSTEKFFAFGLVVFLSFVFLVGWVNWSDIGPVWPISPGQTRNLNVRLHKEFIVIQLTASGEPSMCFRAHQVTTGAAGVHFQSEYNRQFMVSAPYVLVEYKAEGDVGLADKGYEPIMRMMGMDINKCWWGKYDKLQEKIVR